MAWIHSRPDLPVSRGLVVWGGGKERSLFFHLSHVVGRMMFSRVCLASDHIQLMCTMIQRDLEIFVSHRRS